MAGVESSVVAAALTGEPASRAIRVLHVVVSLDAGGMERVLVRVAQALVPRGFDISVCGLERRGVLAPTFPLPEQVISLDKPAGRSWRSILRLQRLIRRVRPDLLHTHNLGPLIYASAASGFGRLCPILHGEHCQLRCADLGPPRLALRRLLYRGCRRVHTVSQEARRELLASGVPAERVVAVVNGVDTDAFGPGDRLAARRRLGVPVSGQHIAISARFERRKRHELLLAAVGRLVAQGLDIHLLLAGDGDLRPHLEDVARRSGAAERIHFLGFREDIQTVYQAADLAVLPSTGEGLSNAILEAMACGVPVLCHSACGCAEVVADEVDGWVRNIDSPDTLAALLQAILSHPEPVRLAGRAARAKMVAQFDFRETVAGYERLYRAVTVGQW